VSFRTMNRRSFFIGFAAVASDMQRQFLPRVPSTVLAQADQDASVHPSGFPVALNSNRIAFIDQHGTPCFACGDAPQYLIQQLSRPEIDLYLADRASRGFNILWMIAADGKYQSNPPNNLNGDPPFNGADFTNFNEPYWAYVDHVMQRALTYGMTVLLMPAFMGLTDSGGYRSVFYNSSDAVLQGYASFLGNRYKSFPNLIWTLGGDADPANSAMYAKLNTFAIALKATDPGHLMTLEATRSLEAGGIAANGGYSSVDAHNIAYGSVQSWLDFNWVDQTAATCISGAQRCYSQGLPCLLGEDWYELEQRLSDVQLRTEAYGVVLGGCVLGRLMGNGAIWPFNSVNAQNRINAGPPTWQSQLNSSGSVGQQLLGRLFRSRQFSLLVPDIAHVVMTAGSVGGSVCASTSDEQTIIAYLPTRQTVTIDMTKITDATNLANCNWYNPTTGAVTAIGSFTNSGELSFTSPDSNDWVLVIDSAVAGLKPPGT
jgi:hypothetical protein